MADSTSTKGKTPARPLAKPEPAVTKRKMLTPEERIAKLQAELQAAQAAAKAKAEARSKELGDQLAKVEAKIATLQAKAGDLKKEIAALAPAEQDSAAQEAVS